MADLWLLGVLVLLCVTFALWGLFSIQRARHGRLRRLIERPGVEEPLPERTGPDPEAGPLARLAALLRPLLPAAVLQNANWRLLWAGRPMGWSAEEFVAARLSLALLLGALAPFLLLRLKVTAGAGAQILLVMLLAVVGLVMPDLWLTNRVDARRRQVQRELPLFLDLLAAAVEAGLSLGEAIRRVSEELTGLVAAEFMRAYQEMAAGKPRAAAWRDLADRTPSQELRAVAVAILQSEQYGTSVATQLRLQVRQLREARQRWAQEMAQAASVKMRIPMRTLK